VRRRYRRVGTVVPVSEPDNNATDPPSGDIAPGSLAWRIQVATLAHRFFGMIHDPNVAQLINQPADAGKAGAWPVAYFELYLQKIGVPTGEATVVSRMLDEMARAGLLMRAGWRPDMGGLPMMGELYISQGSRSPQTQGTMWLSGVLGPDLIIEAYKLVTVEISGVGSPRWGTGLVLDRAHVLTNKHVTRALRGHDIEIRTRVPVSGEEVVTRQTRLHEHAELDVAVIEVEPPEAGSFTPLPGMVFRDPAWADEVYLLGYPRVPWMVETDITVQRGEVVNPLVRTPRIRDDDTEAAGIIPSRGKAFLYSAIARPGNSGGPIVAHDGRVIGIVVESTEQSDSSDPSQGASAEREQTCPTITAIWKELHQFVSPDSGCAPEESRPIDDEPPSAPFYRGIRTSEIVRALDDFKLGSLIVVENPA
jgi:S1-C subfamily serine protease